MDILVNELLKITKQNDKTILFYYLVIALVLISLLQRINLLNYFIILIIIIFVIILINSNRKFDSENKINSIKETIPKIKKSKINKKLIASDNQTFLKNFLLNINYLKKYNKTALNSINENITKFMVIDEKSTNFNTFRYKYYIEKLYYLKNKIINDIHSIIYSIPSIQGVEKNKIYLEPLHDKLIFSLNLFDKYSNSLISSKIKINNENFNNNIDINSSFLIDVDEPQPFNFTVI